MSSITRGNSLWCQDKGSVSHIVAELNIDLQPGRGMQKLHEQMLANVSAGRREQAYQYMILVVFGPHSREPTIRKNS